MIKVCYNEVIELNKGAIGMLCVRIWDYLMRRKGLFLMLVAFFSLSGFTTYQLIQKANQELEVPKSGDPEIVVDTYIEENQIEVAQTEPEVKPPVEPTVSKKVGGEQNGIEIEPQENPPLEHGSTVVDPMDDYESHAWNPDQAAEPAELANPKPSVNIGVVAGVSAAVIAVEVVIRRLVRKRFPKDNTV